MNLFDKTKKLNKLQEIVDTMESTKMITLDINEYNTLLNEAILLHEYACVVFIYDYMNHRGIKPNNETYKIIEKGHDKKLIEHTNIKLKEDGIKRLPPKRRIHKIIKGHNYSDQYQSALKYLDIVKNFLNDKEELKKIHKDKLCKEISKNCNITIRESKYTITNLKRTKFI